jgi:hypothetical protein
MSPASAATLEQAPQRVTFSGRQRADLVSKEDARYQAPGAGGAPRGQGHRDCATVVGMGQPLGQTRRSRLSIAVTIALR